MPSTRTLRLMAVGTLAGGFSGLFGVGGGTVIVPLLILWFAYEPRMATGTSLAAIILIALFAAFGQGVFYGNVEVGKGLLLSIPAAIGMILGTTVQQRMPQQAVSLVFAGLLVLIAADMVLK